MNFTRNQDKVNFVVQNLCIDKRLTCIIYLIVAPFWSFKANAGSYFEENYERSDQSTQVWLQLVGNFQSIRFCSEFSIGRRRCLTLLYTVLGPYQISLVATGQFLIRSYVKSSWSSRPFGIPYNIMVGTFHQFG